MCCSTFFCFESPFPRSTPPKIKGVYPTPLQLRSKVWDGKVICIAMGVAGLVHNYSFELTEDRHGIPRGGGPNFPCGFFGSQTGAGNDVIFLVVDFLR